MIKTKIPIERVDIIDDDTPAQLDIENGIIYVNQRVYDKLPVEYQNFVLAHEEGHYTHNTYDEFTADAYAFKRLAGKKPGSLMNIVNTIADVLDIENNPQHRERFAEIYRHAMRYNYSKTGEQKYLDEIEKFNSKMYSMKKASFYGSDQYAYATETGYSTETPEDIQPEPEVITTETPQPEVVTNEYNTTENNTTNNEYNGFFKGLFSKKEGEEIDETEAEIRNEAKNWITTRGMVTIAIVIAVFVIAYLIAKKQTS